MGNIIIEGYLAQTKNLLVGEKAIDFTLPTNNGGEWRLSENHGKVIALLFYPQNETLVCTKQLCSVRDHWADYLETKATIVGISPGTVEKHLEFAQKYKLPMPLLVDEGRKITSVFGKHSWLPIYLTRAVVIIDAKGIVRHKKVMFRGFRPKDYSVISSIYQAKTDLSQEKFNKILENHKDRKMKFK